MIPVNHKWPLQEVRRALLELDVRSGEKITFEYVMLAGINDGPANVKGLAALVQGLTARVNLIPWNEDPRLPYSRPTDEDVEAFRDALLGCGIDVSIRFSKGRDVGAACGQLVTSSPSHNRSPTG